MCLHPQRVEKNIRCSCRGKVSLSELGWPNLLLRDKLPTGNEQGSAGMATVGNGAYTYEPVKNWAKLPPGWSFKETVCAEKWPEAQAEQVASVHVFSSQEGAETIPRDGVVFLWGGE
jgi:hypothetical protein